VNPRYVFFFMTRVRCSILICVALSRMGGRPRPASFSSLCTPLEEKLGSRPGACRIALLRIPSMVVCYLPRCVAWYLDFNSCYVAVDLREGLSLRFARVFASIITSLVIWRKCSRKSNMEFMWTPSILYDLFGGRYLIWEPSEHMIESICYCRMEKVLWLRGLPCAQRAPVASHFEVSSWSPVYWLKKCSF
jgi:hypothetical protein